MTTAFSYQRFSSPSQADGDSIRRQSALRDAWLSRSGAVLDTSLSLSDRGVSGFTGSHRANPDRNALAAFLELVRRGRIPRGSYLIVESLDRLTREHIRPALTLLLNLIESGIRVVQLIPVETVYDDTADVMKLTMAIMELSRGHSESRMKSERVGAAWRAKKKAAATSGVPITRALPAWIQVKGGKLALIPDKAKAVSRIYSMATAGHGLGAITKTLNTTGVTPIARAKHWARSYIAKILANRATFGEYQPHTGHAGPDRKPDGPAIPGYFPAVVSEDVYHAAQLALTGRRHKGGRPMKRINIFTGLLRDARDGGTLQVINKGEKASGPALVSYRAVQGIAGASYVSFPLSVFEDAILTHLKEIDPREILPPDDKATDRVSALAGRLTRLEGRIEKVQAELVDGGELAPLVTVLRKLEGERATVADELELARRIAATPLSAAWKDYATLALALKAAPNQNDARTRLRGALRRIVESIWCVFVERGPVRLAAVQVWFAGGAHRDYIITRANGHGNAAYKRVGRTETLSHKFDIGTTAIDLHKRADAAKTSKLLERLELD